MRQIKQTMASSSILCISFPLWKLALVITLLLSFGRFGNKICCTQDVPPFAS
ncbi:hypothetical protein [Holospora undulata]|uniref:hypothetical protein n=1 Tax=Holospora undulata TaxID=1169117 RepID=UPI001F2EA97B|nr:hypothetical protein [Holospora undulata]